MQIRSPSSAGNFEFLVGEEHRSRYCPVVCNNKISVESPVNGCSGRPATADSMALRIGNRFDKLGARDFSNVQFVAS